MTEHSKKLDVQLVLNVLNAYTATTRTAQVRLCHGLVPAVVELREATEQLDTLLDHGWVRSKRTAQALAHVHGIKTQLANCIGVIESRTAEVGYPLERHHSDRAGVLGDPRLFGGDDVHDHAAFQHLRESALHARRAGVASGHGIPFDGCGRSVSRLT